MDYNIYFTQEFKDIAMYPGYLITGIYYITIPITILATPNDEINVDDFNERWKADPKITSTISNHTNSYINNNGDLQVSIRDYNSIFISPGNNHIGLIYTDMIEGKDKLMAIIPSPNTDSEVGPSYTEWARSNDGAHDSNISYIFNLGKILDGIKCDLILHKNEVNFNHIDSSDVDKHVVNYIKDTDDYFIIKNSAEYYINRSRNKDGRRRKTWMVNPSGLVNYGSHHLNEIKLN